MTGLPKAPLARILKKAGVVRASPDAVDALAEALEGIGEGISKKAVELAHFARRETVRKEDVKLASE